MKTKIYNLIILDESGSMDCVCSQTISGCNETINTIKTAASKYADAQEHYVSIFAFQSGSGRPSRYIIKNVEAEKALHITDEDYEPWGCTPLYDAVGSTLTDLKSIVKTEERAIGSVTIITDGFENASTQYSGQKVANMIEALKEMGWNFNFIGANIDVESVAHDLNIDNTLSFNQTSEGTKAMFHEELDSRMAYYSRVMEASAPCMCKEEFSAKMKIASKGYFGKNKAKDKNKK